MPRCPDPSGLSLAQIRAICSAPATASRALGRRLLRDRRAGARALGEKLLRELAATRAEDSRQRRRLSLEEACWARGLGLVAGVDEAGMGPLAGPVVAAAVILDPAAPVLEANDSKQLSRAERERLEGVVKARALAWSVGVASVAEIGETDIHQAGLRAMQRAVAGLRPVPQHLLVDARVVPGVGMSQEAHVKGDARSCSIAAASILAKVERDRVMSELAIAHPGYGFEIHAGYGTPAHLEALRRLGPCAAHRVSWKALADYSGELSRAYYTLKEELGDVPRSARGAELATALRDWRLRVHALLSELSADEVRRLDTLARRVAASVTSRPRRSGQPVLFEP